MSNPKWPQQPNFPPQPGAPAQGNGQQPYASTQAMEFQPGQLQALVNGPPSQQGSPFGQPPQQGSPFGQPPQQGSPFGQQPQQPAWGQPPQQPQQPAWGQPPQQPQQPAWGQAPQQQQQPAWGQAPQQPAWGQGAQGYAAPPARPAAAANGRSALSMLGAGLLVVAAVGAKVALRTGGRSVSHGISSASTSTIRPLPSFNNARTARAAATPDERLQDKIDPYVQHCLNRFTRPIFDAESRYFQWVDRAKGPTGRERIVYGIYNVTGDPAECSRAVTTAAALTPSTPDLEGAGPRFAAAAAVLVPLIRQAHLYYASPVTYRGDNMAQGALLHPQLMAAFASFATAQRALSDAVSANQDVATEGFLARARTDPSLVVEYHLKNGQRMARHLSRALRTVSVDRRGALVGIDPITFGASVNEYQMGVSNLASVAVQNPLQASAVRGLPLYQTRSGAYLRQLQLLQSRAQSGLTFSRGEMRLIGLRVGWTVQGSPDAANRAYNDLVQSYNSLR